jgi:transposase InsO family protein
VIDYYSRFPEVEIVRSITSATIINKLRKIFAVHGICNEIVSDNGSQFVSEEFKSYLEELGIKHTRITPYWARANGLVENFNKSLKKAIRVAPAENKNWHNKLYTFLLQYRNTPHFIAEMVLQCAIQMSDIPKDIKKLSNEDCLFIFTNVTLV